MSLDIMLFSGFICLPPSAHKCVHAHMNTQMQGLGRLHLTSCVSLWAEGQQSH